MITHKVLTRQLSPTPAQAAALLKQLDASRKIIEGCPVGSGNPFGQSKETFVVQYGVHLWANVNSAMMGFPEAALRSPKWANQFNYRHSKALEFYPDGALYIPALSAEAGSGRLAVDGEPVMATLPDEARVSHITIRVDMCNGQWLCDFYITDRPRRTNKKRRKPIYT